MHLVCAIAVYSLGMADLSAEIEANAQGPKSVTVDGNNVQQHSLKEQMEADEYLAGKTNNARSALPIRFAKLKPGSAIS